jgi:LPLT family lysophospholipid transporter-like MFS transporter
MKMNFQPWGLAVLKLENNTKVAMLGLSLGVGIVAGSLLAGFRYKVGDLRHTRIFGFGLGLAIISLSLVKQIPPVLICLVITGAIAGLFLIPLNAALQAETDGAKLGKTIAIQNLLDNVTMILGGVCVFLSARLNPSPQFLWAALGGITILVLLALNPGKAKTTVS